jgi:TatA/E family protein of Tat protein translocase
MPFLREPSHILILLIVVTVLFGAKRLPDSARSLGRSMRIFKSEMKEMKSDEPENKGKNEDSPEK